MSRVTIRVECPICGNFHGYVRQVVAGAKPEDIFLECAREKDGKFVASVQVTVEVVAVYSLERVKK